MTQSEADNNPVPPRDVAATSRLASCHRDTSEAASHLNLDNVNDAMDFYDGA